jgi:hypothetical protein
MFGGLAFLIDEKMAVSASSQGGLLLRIDPTLTESLVSKPHIRRFEMRGREMDGWLRVDTDVLETDEELRRWVGRGVSYARSLPPKSRVPRTTGHTRSGPGATQAVKMSQPQSETPFAAPPSP